MLPWHVQVLLLLIALPTPKDQHPCRESKGQWLSRLSASERPQPLADLKCRRQQKFSVSENVFKTEDESAAKWCTKLGFRCQWKSCATTAVTTYRHAEAQIFWLLSFRCNIILPPYTKRIPRLPLVGIPRSIDYRVGPCRIYWV